MEQPPVAPSAPDVEPEHRARGVQRNAPSGAGTDPRPGPGRPTSDGARPDHGNAATRWQLRRVGGGLGAVLTVTAALWGAVTGTLAWRDQQHIKLLVNAQDVTVGDGFDAVRISVVNSSSRAVALIDGELRTHTGE